MAESGLSGHLAPIQVDRQGGVSVGGQAVRPVADVIVEPPPLMDHHDARQGRRAPLGQAEVTRASGDFHRRAARGRGLVLAELMEGLELFLRESSRPGRGGMWIAIGGLSREPRGEGGHER